MPRPETPPQVIEVGDEYCWDARVMDLDTGEEVLLCRAVNCEEGWADCYVDDKLQHNHGLIARKTGNFQVVWGDED